MTCTATDIVSVIDDITSVETIEVKLSEGYYTPANLTSHLNQLLSPYGVTVSQASGPNPPARPGEFQLNFTYDGPEEGEYLIEGIRGNASHAIFYQSDMSYRATVTGAMPLDESTTISAGVNNELTVFINNDYHTVILESGVYNRDELAEMIRDKFVEAGLAEIDDTFDHVDNKLRFSLNSSTPIRVQEIRGNAANTLVGVTGIPAFFAEDKSDTMQHIEAGTSHIQVGPMKNQHISMNIPISLCPDKLRINSIMVLNYEDAVYSLKIIDSAIEKTVGIRADLGALQNTLAGDLLFTEIYRENIISATSRINDSNIAFETLEFTKRMIQADVINMIFKKEMINNKRIVQLLMNNVAS